MLTEWHQCQMQMLVDAMLPFVRWLLSFSVTSDHLLTSPVVVCSFCVSMMFATVVQEKPLVISSVRHSATSFLVQQSLHG